MPKTLCKTFQDQALWTWESLATACRLGVHLGEESLTDFNLLAVRSHHATTVFTKTFTKSQESREGADWEWWFVGPKNTCIGFRVQAKVIEFQSDEFKHLHYFTPAGKFQPDLLCQQATGNGINRIPIYCLYSHWDNNKYNAPWRCKTFTPAIENFGCAVVDAFFVRNAPRTAATRTLANLIPHMMPWHCLVCCEGYAPGGDLPERVLGLWQNLIRDRDTTSEFQAKILSEPPRYVQLLLQNELQERPDENIRTVTVFRQAQPEHGG